MTFWWLGINNQENRRDDVKVVLVSEIDPFLKQEHQTFPWNTRGAEWPFKKDRPDKQSLYDQMSPGDHVLLWLGPGKRQRWGILGSCSVDRGAATNPAGRGRSVTLHSYSPLPVPMCPRISGDRRFLTTTFPERFEPLARELHGRGKPITVAWLDPSWYQAVLAFE